MEEYKILYGGSSIEMVMNNIFNTFGGKIKKSNPFIGPPLWMDLDVDAKILLNIVLQDPECAIYIKLDLDEKVSNNYNEA